MNRKAQHYNMSNWSASAVSVLVAAFMVMAGYYGWAFGFGFLAVVLAIIPYL